MAKYEIIFKKSVARDFSSVPARDVKSILSRIDTLARNPRGPGTLKLSGMRDLYRIRQGKYRILYEIQDERLIVLVVRVAHRSAVYES